MDTISMNTDPSMDSGQAILDAVRDSAILATLSMGMWTGIKTDRERVAELKAQHGAAGDVGRFTKNLLAGADGPLKVAQSAFRAVRTLHYRLTIAWGSPEQGLLSTLAVESYLTQMAEARNAAMKAKEEFIYVYPSCIPTAQSNLGTMSDGVYPTVDEVRSSFYINIDFEPIADRNAGSFKKLGGIWGPKFIAAMDAKHNQKALASQRAMWDRVKQPVEKLIKDLTELNNDENKKFYESSIQHVRDLLVLLPGWNMTNDPRVDAMVADIEGLIDNIDHKTAKTSPSVRATTIAAGQTIVDRLNQIAP